MNGFDNTQETHNDSLQAQKYIISDGEKVPTGDLYKAKKMVEKMPPFNEGKEAVFKWIYQKGPKLQDISEWSWPGIKKHLRYNGTPNSLAKDYSRWKKKQKSEEDLSWIDERLNQD